MTAGDRHAVAAALDQVVLAREQAADDGDVLEDDLSFRVQWPKTAVRPNAGRLERMAGRIEWIGGQPVLGWRRFDGQIEERLDETTVGAADQPAAGDPLRVASAASAGRTWAAAPRGGSRRRAR